MPSVVQTETQLERTLGLTAALMIGVGTMIGAGIFVLPGPAAALAGPAIVLSFLLGGAIAFLTALSASELATAMPAAGGSYHYINRGLGPFFGAIAGLGNWLGLAFATAFYVLGFGSYLGLVLAGVTTPEVALGPYGLTDAQLGAMAATVGFVAVNYVSTKSTGDLQNVIVIGLLVILGAFVVAGTYVADLATLRPIAPEGIGPVLPATALIFVSYLGFVKITTVAGEIRNPSRNLPRALVGSVALVTVVYVIIMIVVLGVVDRGAIATSETAVATVAGIVTAEVIGYTWIGIGVLTFAGLLATASSANASILAASRINFAMGRDEIVSPWVNAIHPRFNTPGRAILLTGGFVVVFVLIGDVATLAKAAAVLHLLVYGLVNVALIVFRETDAPEYAPTFTVPLYPWVPIAGALCSFGLIAFMDPIEIGLAGAFVLVGVVWYVGYVRAHTEDDSALARYRRPETVESRVDVEMDHE